MRTLLLVFFISAFSWMGKAQTSSQLFDTVQFNKQLELANYLLEYDYYTQLVIDKFSKMPETSDMEWYSYKENNIWHSIGGKITGNKFMVKNQVVFDSAYNISDFKGASDTSKLNTSGSALSIANSLFKPIRDTSNIYFNAFVINNPDQTISVWHLPAFQPSGQGIYGCEWEYNFDKTGRNVTGKNSYIGTITGVWIGQPRELWLNYRNTDSPTVGSIFFALSFRDYFTRIRIDTRLSISTTSKDANGNYTWTHKMKIPPVK